MKNQSQETQEINKAIKSCRGSILDLVGGRTKLPKTEPSGTASGQRLEVLRMKLSPSSSSWETEPETLSRRLRRVKKALKNLPDLLG